jgi:hypothetical protein
MPCGDEMATKLSRYVDGEMTPEERDSVEGHVAGCESCRDLLSLFQKNENLLSGALSSESFGNVVIESVMRSIQGGETPPEAKPVEAGFWDRLRERPLVPLAAAAAALVALTAFLTVSQARRAEDISRLVAQTKDEALALRRDIAAQREENEKIRQELTVRLATREASEFSTLGYMGPNHYLVVRASFDAKAFKEYGVYRRDEDKGDETYAEINTGRLPEPVFTDATVKGGKGYVYKFRAWRGDGSYADSAPMLMRGLLIPEGSLKIHCTDIAAPKDMAVFEIEKTVNGKPLREQFIVRLNEPVGKIRDGVDFSTGYVLDRIEEGMQWIEVTYTAPMTDDTGRPIIERFGKNSLVPATMTVRHDTPIAQRERRRALLRPAAGTSADRGEVSIWQGARVWARVR